MKYTVTKNLIWVLGKIWMPPVPATMTYELDALQMYNLLAETDNYDPVTIREATALWLAKNSGDFQEIIDFAASLEIDGETVEIGWHSEDNMMTYNDLTFQR